MASARGAIVAEGVVRRDETRVERRDERRGRPRRPAGDATDAIARATGDRGGCGRAPRGRGWAGAGTRRDGSTAVDDDARNNVDERVQARARSNKRAPPRGARRPRHFASRGSRDPGTRPRTTTRAHPAAAARVLAASRLPRARRRAALLPPRLRRRVLLVDPDAAAAAPRPPTRACSSVDPDAAPETRWTDAVRRAAAACVAEAREGPRARPPGAEPRLLVFFLASESESAAASASRRARLLEACYDAIADVAPTLDLIPLLPSLGWDAASVALELVPRDAEWRCAAVGEGRAGRRGGGGGLGARVGPPRRLSPPRTDRRPRRGNDEDDEDDEEPPRRAGGRRTRRGPPLCARLRISGGSASGARSIACTRAIACCSRRRRSRRGGRRRKEGRRGASRRAAIARRRIARRIEGRIPLARRIARRTRVAGARRPRRMTRRTRRANAPGRRCSSA